jgi:hypothetical protein
MFCGWSTPSSLIAEQGKAIRREAKDVISLILEAAIRHGGMARDARGPWPWPVQCAIHLEVVEAAPNDDFGAVLGRLPRVSQVSHFGGNSTIRRIMDA